MITDIDHIVLLCSSTEQGREIYETLLGRNADWQSVDLEGISSVFFQLDGIALELISPYGDTPLANKLKARLHEPGSALQSIVFRSDALEEDRRIFERRALQPSLIQAGQSIDNGTENRRHWNRFRINDECAGGLRLFALQRFADDPLVCKPAARGAILDLDHLVVETCHPDRATALYGARLGLRLTLDLSIAERDIRMLSFKAGKSRIELSHRISKAGEELVDKFWGLTWRTDDIDLAHLRMKQKGLNVSEVRQGLTKGTRVFTVRDGTLNVPTLVLCNDARR
jgi:catechol 2,3-dioxygenase-like lactoylglutathione lyase family enzyme